MAQLELILEYRSSDASIPYQARREFTAGFLAYHDELWEEIDRRNEQQSVQIGFVKQSIPTFNEEAVREVILNAVSHRDLQRAGSVFVRQYPRRIVVVSPGGLPPGITPENILFRQEPRNRLLAQSLERCGLVERSGQGMDLIVKNQIRESKTRPDFRDTDDYQVSVTLPCEVRNPDFVRFLEKVGQERQQLFTTEDYLVLEAISQEKPVPEAFRGSVPHLIEMGAVERVSRGRAARFMLSRGFYEHVGRPGQYTRKRGLDRDTNKALLLKHLRDHAETGSPLKDLKDVLPALTHDQVQGLLRQLKKAREAHPKGRTKTARWYPGPQGEGAS